MAAVFELGMRGLGSRGELGFPRKFVACTLDSCLSSGNLRLVKQSIVTLDLEGVLVPEIWIAVAEKTGIEGLKKTTRDEPDYDVLMRGRLELLSANDLNLKTLQEIIGTLSPLEGACDFLNNLRTITQVIILSDTFEEFAKPLMRQLEWPTLLCHRLSVENDQVTDYLLRLPDQKRQAVEAFKNLNYQVIAAGDSYNDTGMLTAADHGILFRAPEKVKAEFPQFNSVESFNDLWKEIQVHL